MNFRPLHDWMRFGDRSGTEVNSGGEFLLLLRESDDHGRHRRRRSQAKGEGGAREG